MIDLYKQFKKKLKVVGCGEGLWRG